MSSVPFLDVYIPSAHRPSAEGTVLCSVALGNFPTPAGPVSSTQSGHGNWIRVAKNTYAFTVWRLRVNLTTGMTVGWAKFWGAVTVTGPDEYTGTMNSENYDLGGHLLFAASGGTSVAERIEVQVEAQP